MKKVILYFATCVLIMSSMAATPDSKTLQRFNATFPNAKDIKWRDDKSGYFVTFIQNGNFNKVFYNTKGNFIYALNYNNGDELPTNITMELSKKYGKYKIVGVTEVTTQNNMFYNIKFSKENKLNCSNVSTDGLITNEEVFDDGTGTN